MAGRTARLLAAWGTGIGMLVSVHACQSGPHGHDILWMGLTMFDAWVRCLRVGRADRAIEYEIASMGVATSCELFLTLQSVETASRTAVVV